MRLITKMLGVLCGLVMASAAPALGADHFVAPSGSDTWGNSTSSATPCSITTAATNAAAGDTVYLQVGTYNQTAQLTIGGDGTSTNGIVWEPYTSAAGDWDGTPGVVSLVGDGTFDLVRCNGEFNHFRGIKTTGSRAVHNRGWRITGDGCTLYRCIAYRVGSSGFLMAGANIKAIQCEASEIGDSGGSHGFKLQAYRTTAIGCYAHDIVGNAYDSSSSAGYDLGLYYCIANGVVPGSTPGSLEAGAGYVFESTATTDDLWGGTALQTQTAVMLHCVAYGCNVGFEVGDRDTTTNYAQPLLLMNCIADTCTTGINSVYAATGTGDEKLTALTLMGMGFYNCGTNIDDNSFVITRYSADTIFTASPFADAAGGDFSLTAAVTGWPTAFVSGGAMTSWAAYPQLGAVPKDASSGGGGTRSMRMGL